MAVVDVVEILFKFIIYFINYFQLAKECKLVIGVEIDSQKLIYAKINSNIYEVDSKIVFINGDFLDDGTLK